MRNCFNMKCFLLFQFLIFCICGCISVKESGAAEDVTIKVDRPKLQDDSYIIDYSLFPQVDGKVFWKEKIKVGKPDVTLLKDKELDVNVLNVKSNKSSYYYQKAIDPDIDKYGYISWKWKVIENPKGGDIRKAGTNDKAIQVFLAFEGRYLLSYIWGPAAPVGFIKDVSVPFLFHQKIIVVESGDQNLNQWLTVHRDIKADYRKVYNKEAPKLKGIAIWANSQNTKTKSEALIGPISFQVK